MIELATPIVGARFRPPAPDILNNMPGDIPLICVREPDNAFDSNAIKVMVAFSLLGEVLSTLYDEERPTLELDDEGRFHLGYVPKEEAETIAPVLDGQSGVCPGKLGFNLEGRPCVIMSIEHGQPDTAPQAVA